LGEGLQKANFLSHLSSLIPL